MAIESGLAPGMAARLQELPQFVRFSIVGVVGLVVDVSVLLFVMNFFGAGPYAGRAVSFLCAATSTWYMNRHFTFAKRPDVHKGKEWLLFVLCGTIAGLLNYGAYALFVFLVGLNSWSAIVGVGLGSCTGLLLNYTLSRHIVFRHSHQS